MFGVIINTITVLLGSMIGLLFKKGIPDKVSRAVMIAIGLCTIYIGISGSLSGNNALIIIISMVLGTIAGTLLNLDNRLNSLGDKLASKMKSAGKGGNISQGFITASMLFCVGSMTVVGALNAGISGDNKLLITKSLLDFVSSMMLAASLGIGVIFAAAFVLVYQGALVALAGVLAPVLTTSAIDNMTCVGSLLIIALGLNLIDLSKFKVSDYLPALIFAPIVDWAYNLISGLISK